jgi:alkylation response protein AidB-like acyl-CoA dehydrogenase
MDEVLRRALKPGPAVEWPSLEAFWEAHVREVEALDAPVDRAILGGVAADRLGYAFAAGYAAALHALVPALRGVAASLAVTEQGPPHPRNVQARLAADGDGWRLTGHKRWITAPGAVLLVLARLDDELALVRVDRDRPGVDVRPLASLPFVPEIPHAEVHFTDVRVEPADRLPGDGWTRWVKPFRTVEDVHVHAALLGLLSATAARLGLPRPLRARIAAQLVGIRALAGLHPGAAATHVALAGAIDEAAALVAAFEPHLPEGEVRARWRRDLPLLGVAGTARAARLERAWQNLEA